MIVIVAKGDDDHAVVVAQTLIHKLNEQVFIFDTSQFPMHYHLEGVIEDDLFDFSLLSQHHQPIKIDKAKSIWWRRPQSMIMATDIQDYSIQNFTLNECISGLYGLLTSCEVLWVNDLKSSYAARRLRSTAGNTLLWNSCGDK